MQQIAVRLGAVHLAVIHRAIQDGVDGVDAAVADHEQDGGNEDAGSNALQESNRGADDKNHPDQQIIPERKHPAGIDQPFHQEGQAKIQQHPSQDGLGKIRDQRRTEEKRQTTEHRGDEINQAAPCPQALGQR